MSTDALQLEDYYLREDDRIYDGRVDHILRVTRGFPIDETDGALLLALGPRLDAHFPARKPSPQLGFFEELGAYDSKLGVVFSATNDLCYWRVAHKKWHDSFPSLAQAVSKVYSRLLLTPGYWACTKDKTPREVLKCRWRKGFPTPQEIELAGLAKQVVNSDMLAAAPSHAELEQLLARYPPPIKS